jgi:hypothetical protein
VLSGSAVTLHPPPGGASLITDGTGNFWVQLSSETTTTIPNPRTLYELDVLLNPFIDLPTLFQPNRLWTFLGGLRPYQNAWTIPFVMTISSVQTIVGNSLDLSTTFKQYFISDGAGNWLYEGIGGPGATFTFPPSTPRPITLILFSNVSPQGNCGACWLAFYHNAV